MCGFWVDQETLSGAHIIREAGQVAAPLKKYGIQNIREVQNPVDVHLRQYGVGHGCDGEAS